MPRDEKKRPDDLAKATIVGFSRINCKKCFGRGYLGFDARYRDQVHVIPCPCVEYMHVDAVRKSVEEKEAASAPPPEENDDRGKRVGHEVPVGQ